MDERIIILERSNHNSELICWTADNPNHFISMWEDEGNYYYEWRKNKQGVFTCNDFNHDSTDEEMMEHIKESIPELFELMQKNDVVIEINDNQENDLNCDYYALNFDENKIESQHSIDRVPTRLRLNLDGYCGGCQHSIDRVPTRLEAAYDGHSNDRYSCSFFTFDEAKETIKNKKEDDLVIHLLKEAIE